MINLATSFVYILLMGGRRGMKLAVQTALQIYLATAGIKVSVWSHLQIPHFIDIIVSM